METNESAAEFIESVFEPLPTFPDEMQNNSVLIKRMTGLKKKQGLTVGKDDEDIGNVNEEEYKSSVSSALSKNKSTTDSRITGFGSEADNDSEKPRKARAAEKASNLLGIDDFLSGVTSGGNGPIDHEFYNQNPNDFSSEQTVNINDEADAHEIEDDNDSKWKSLVPASATDGVIYEDDDIKINLKFNISDHLTKVLLEFASVSSGELSDIKTRLKIPDGLLMSITDVRYPQNPGDNPKAMMSFMVTGNIKETAKIAVRFNTPFDETKTISFKLPVLINKFIDRVEMEQDRFDYLWDDITNNRPSSFEKLDMIINNPASSSGTDHMTVLKKMANLLSACMNMKVLPPENKSSFTKICAVGQISVVDENSDISDDVESKSVPLMVQLEFYPDISIDELRFSIRSNDKIRVVASFAQLFRLFV